MVARSDAMGEMDADTRTWIINYTLSILVHLIFVCGMIFMPEFSFRSDSKMLSSAIQVSLVTLESQAPADRPAAQTPAVEAKAPAPEPKEAPKPPPPEPAPPEPAPPADAVSLAPPAPKAQPKPKTSMKKKTYKGSKVVKEALKRYEQQVAAQTPKRTQTDPDPLKSALEKLRQQVGKSETPRGDLPVGDGKGAPVGEARTGFGSGEQKITKLIDIYRVEVAYKVQKNWAFSQQLAGGNMKLRASLVFKVMPNGEIRDIFFTDRSGNSYLDDSAYKAIVKSNPVDPHPPGILKPYVEIGLRFTPKGIL